MANTIYTVKSLTTVAAKYGAARFKNKLKFCNTVDREDEATFGQLFKSVQPGDTINITKPVRRTPRTDATYSAVDLTEEKVALAVDQRAGDDFELTSLEIATDGQLKSWLKRFVDPVIEGIANNVEQRVLQTVMQATPQMVGTPGTSVNSALTYLQAMQKLQEQCVPDGQAYALITPGANATSVDALKGLLDTNGKTGDAFETGMMQSTSLGLKYQMSNLLWSFTTGTQAGYASALSNGATQTGATIAIDGMTGSATIAKGTIVTFAGVYDVNPITKATLGNLKQFVVTADVTLSGGAGNLSISPTLVSTGTTKNASTSIADNSVITFISGTAASTTYSQNLIYHPSAVRFCSLPLPSDEIKPGVIDAYTETVDGISIRAIKFYDGSTDKVKMRFDTQFGSAVVRPEWLVRATN